MLAFCVELLPLCLCQLNVFSLLNVWGLHLESPKSDDSINIPHIIVVCVMAPCINMVGGPW